MTGILIFDYFLVRHGELHVGDMYSSSGKSAYWYTAGFNWRAIAAWLMGLWPLLRESNFPKLTQDSPSSIVDNDRVQII